MERHNLVFAAACLGMLLFGVVFLSLGSVNNMLAERFHLDDTEIGTLTALLPLGILAGSLAFGPIVDKFGYRWMLVGASLLVGAGLEGMAFANRKGLVQLFVFVIGLGGGALNGATNALAADVSEGERGARLSLLGVFFGIGALCMPATLALLARSFPLHGIVASIGALVLLPVAYCLLIPFPPPRQGTGSFVLADGARLLRNPLVLTAGAALAVQSGMEAMSNDWMTRYFSKVTLAGREGVEWKTQLGLVAVTGAMMATRLALSQLLKRVSSAAVLLGSVLVTAAGAVVLMQSQDYYQSLAAALLIGGGLAAGFPVILGFVGDAYPQSCGTAFSTIFVLALTGNMVINKTFGYVAHVHGIHQYAKVLLACLACSGALIVCLLRETKPNSTIGEP